MPHPRRAVPAVRMSKIGGRLAAGALLMALSAVVLSTCKTPGPPPARSESAISELLSQFGAIDARDLLDRSHRPFVVDREILHLTPDIETLWSGLAEAELGFSEARIRAIKPVYDDSYREFADRAAMRRFFEQAVADPEASIVEIETPPGERYALLLSGRYGRLPRLYGIRGPLASLAAMRSGRVAPLGVTASTLGDAGSEALPHRVIVTGEDEATELAFTGGRLRFAAYSAAAVSEQLINDRRVLKVTPTLGELRLEIDPPVEAFGRTESLTETTAPGDGEGDESRPITAVELNRFGSSITVVVDPRERAAGTEPLQRELAVLAASDGATIFASISGEFAVQTGGQRTRLGPREALEVLPGGRPGERLRWIGETIGYATYERDRVARFLAGPVVGLLQLQRVMAAYRNDVAGGGRDAAHSGVAARAMRVYMLPRLYVAMKVEYLQAYEEPQYLSFAELYRALTDEYELGIEPRL